MCEKLQNSRHHDKVLFPRVLLSTIRRQFNDAWRQFVELQVDKNSQDLHQQQKLHSKHEK